MPEVKMNGRVGSAGNQGKAFPKPGKTFECSEAKARALVHYGLAEYVEDETADEKPAEKPADKRETADSADAAKRETRKSSDN